MSPKITLSPELETFIAQGLTLKKKGPGRMSKKVKETEAERVSLELKNLIEKVSLMSNCPLVSLSTPFEITPISHFRVLKVQDNKSLIHHLFQPNKDEWIDQVLAVSPLSDSSTVSAQWLYDSANANAILDIQDYIVADGKLFHAPVQLQPAPKKPTPKKKRKTSDDESDIDIVLDDSPIDTTDRKKRKTAVAVFFANFRLRKRSLENLLNHLNLFALNLQLLLIIQINLPLVLGFLVLIKIVVLNSQNLMFLVKIRALMPLVLLQLNLMT